MLVECKFHNRMSVFFFPPFSARPQKEMKDNAVKLSCPENHAVVPTSLQLSNDTTPLLDSAVVIGDDIIGLLGTLCPTTVDECILPNRIPALYTTTTQYALTFGCLPTTTVGEFKFQ